MFSYSDITHRSNMEKVSIHELFDDVKLTGDGEDLKEQGYIPLDYEYVPLKLKYMVKPSLQVIEYMKNSGRGMPNKAEIGINNTIAFTANWDGYETQPRIAGVVDQKELSDFKKSAPLVGECIVKKAYDNFKKEHPNFALRSVREPVGTELNHIQRLAKLVWVAVGYSLRSPSIIKKAENGEFKNFYLNQKKLNTLKNKFNIDVPQVAKEKRIDSQSNDLAL